MTKCSNDHEQINESEISENVYVHDLDKSIMLDEVTRAGKRMKEGKTTCDGWCPMMVNSISTTFYPLIVIQ